MTQRSTKVLTRAPRPTKNRYRSAIAAIIRQIKAQHGLTNDELGERVGCTGQTIGNAENERNDLSGLTLANIQHEFGADAIDEFQALAGARGVPEAAPHASESDLIAAMGDVIGKLARIKSVNSDAGELVTPTEARDVLPTLRQSSRDLDALIVAYEQMLVRAA